MNNIKITTELHSMGGFTTNEAHIIISGYRITNFKEFATPLVNANPQLQISIKAYKSLADFTAGETLISLKALPVYNESVAVESVNYTEEDLAAMLLDFYLLKGLEAELV